jgi:glycosyltransferase involved in cell wall biosynthesis
MSLCTFVSFRLGLTDGVSIVARHWQRAMESFGFETLTVAGEGPVDRTVAGLELGATRPPNPGEVSEALADADLIVVENLCTIPLNLPAARAVAAVCRNRPTLMHHHDPPWQRNHFAHITELPIDDPAWRHVTINDLTRQQFADRGLTATRIYNGFPTDTTGGTAPDVRAALGISDTETLLAHPVRAIERKNVAEAIALAEAVAGTYWLWGPAEDGYEQELQRLIAQANCRVIHAVPPGHVGLQDPSDLYRAANAVLFPSTWEGFGNPPIEAALHDLPVAVGAYPVANELRALGFTWLPTDTAEPLRQVLNVPDPEMLARNRAIATEHFSLSTMTANLRTLLTEAGWLP